MWQLFQWYVQNTPPHNTRPQYKNNRYWHICPVGFLMDAWPMGGHSDTEDTQIFPRTQSSRIHQ